MANQPLPTLDKTPKGLDKATREMVMEFLAGSPATTDGIKAFYEGDVDHDGHKDAADFICKYGHLASVPAIYWCSLKLSAIRMMAPKEDTSEKEALAYQSYEQQLEEVGDDLVSRYAIAKDGHYYEIKTGYPMKRETVVSQELDKMPTPPKGAIPDPAFVLNRRPDKVKIKCSGVDMSTEDRFFTDDDGELILNLWPGKAAKWKRAQMKPKAGDASPLWKHILFLCNQDEKDAKHLLDWMAYVVQNPGKKVKHSILIISDQGYGKDTLGEAMARVIGKSQVAKVEESLIDDGRYTWAEWRRLAVISETHSSDRNSLANKLKELITGDSIFTNPKNLPAVEIPNTLNFMFFSNYLNAVALDESDRRYFVIRCKGERPGPDYFKALYDFIRGPELACFARVLLERDLSKFDPNEPARHTEAKSEVAEASQGDIKGFLKHVHESFRPPFHKDLVIVDDVAAYFQASGDRPGGKVISRNRIMEFLRSKDAGGGPLGRVYLGGAPKAAQTSLWAVRDHARISKLSNPALVLMWEKDSYAAGAAYDKKAAMTVVKGGQK